MYLDNRSIVLLKEILHNPNITTTELQKKFNLTRRQIDYSFKKINNSLEGNSYPKIHRRGRGYFAVDPYLFKIIGEIGEESRNGYILSDNERVNLIILMLITYNEELSLYHFITELGVSKNTILRDLKLVHSILEEHELTLQYSRKDGYIINGDEWNQRGLLILILEEVIESFNGEENLQRFLKLSKKRLLKLKEKLLQVEKHLKLNFSDNRMRILPYVLGIIFQRIKKGCSINLRFLSDYSELEETNEYGVTEFLIKGEVSTTKEERIYITLQLLISDLSANQYYDNEKATQIKIAVGQVLIKFEEESCIQLNDKQLLLNKIFVHMKAAYYRIKYCLSWESGMLENIDQEFKNINLYIQKSIKPLENYIGVKIPKDEIMSITIIVASHLIEIKGQTYKKINAAIVCQHGIALTTLMEKKLCNLFPEIHFYKPMSPRDFERSKIQYDMVFSSIGLNSNEEQFLIDFNYLMNVNGQSELRIRVLRSIYKLNKNPLSVYGVLTLIEPYVEIKDKLSLEKVLADYLV